MKALKNHTADERDFNFLINGKHVLSTLIFAEQGIENVILGSNLLPSKEGLGIAIQNKNAEK